MTAPDLTPVPGRGAPAREAEAAHPEEGLPPGFGAGLWGRALFWIAIVFSAFQILTAAWPALPSQVVRAMHVGFLLLVGFALAANHGRPGARRALLWGLGLLGFATGLYQWIFYADLIRRAGYPEPQDLVVGVILIALVFEAARRVMGVALPIVAGLFLAYCFLGHWLPPPFGHRGYFFDQVVDHMAFGTEGIYGIPTYVSSTYIFLFILFGAFLERAGMVRLFTDVSLGFVGHARGGPAKVAVVSSALMGTISGSGVANVVTTGQFTIPLMKRFGYRPAFAGGVEAVASMGGQIMPPVMGAVAFIMAETLDVPYSQIVTAALVPALLYFGSAFWMVHLEAGRRGLHGLPREEIPDWIAAVRAKWHLVLPLVVLVWLLFSGYTPLFAGMMGLALTAILILGAPISVRIPVLALRVLFWVAVGLACASFGWYGVAAVGLAALALAILNLFDRGGRETLLIVRDALAEGARNALPVGIACALVGIIVGTMTLTGIASTFGAFIVSIGEESLFLSLVLTMLTCLVLGMGIPTIPNYIITSSLVGPALLELGVPLIVSHMFVFYFGILADLTPPVALAAFAAAPIARESGLKIGIQAVRIALAGFVVPFMAVYTPALMLQDGGALAEAIGYWPAVAYIVLKALLAVGLWGAAAIGWLGTRLSWPARLLATAAAFSLVVAISWTDALGFALVALFVAWRVFDMRAARPAGASQARPGR